MSIARTPPQTPITCHDGNRNVIAITSCSERAGGSQPDLRQLTEYDINPETQRQITFRHKRRHPEDDLAAKFEQFQVDIKSMLTDMAKIQTENLNKISQEVTCIKDQISQIKATTDNLSTEQTKLKLELAKVADFKSNIEHKVNSLEKELLNLKTISTPQIQQQLFKYEDFMSETRDRLIREKNIIISGIDEIQSTNSEERRNYDVSQVNKMIKFAVPNCSEPIKAIRLGKYNCNRSRPIKVIFKSPETPKLILKNRTKIQQEKFKIYSDETPQQKKYRLNLRVELERHINEGEKDITIKYIHGIPKITKIESKN